MQDLTRRATLLAALALALPLTACGGPGKPEEAATRFFKLVEAKKQEEAVAMFSTKDLKAAELTAARGKFMMIVGQMQGAMEANGGLDEVVIHSVDRPADDTAHVKLTLRFKNGETKDERMALVLEDSQWRFKLN